MKKLLLALVLVFATGMFVNANSSSDEVILAEVENTVAHADEFFGCASDCVKASKKKIKDAAEVLGEDPNDHVDDFLEEYHDCYYSNCV